MTELVFDALNRFQVHVNELAAEGRFPPPDDDDRLEVEEDIIDEMLDLYLLAYAEGNERTNKELNGNVPPDTTLMTETIDRRFDGEDFRDRARKYVREGSPEKLYVVADSDSHRVFSTAAYDAAERGGAVTKTWITMEDNKVRDTHDYIHGVSVPMGERFHTFDGDSARFPGDFEYAENNVNCRCDLVFSKTP